MFAGTDQRRRRNSRARDAVAPTRQPPATPELYPMYVLSLPDLLSMDKLRTHQEIMGQLRVYDPSMGGKVIFLSHQWLGWSAPDPNNEQFDALKRLLRRMMSGEAGDVEMDWQQQLAFKDNTKVTAAELKAALPHMFMWIDYASMPQPAYGKTEADGDGATTADHRFDGSETADQLMHAVESIPSYVERSALILVLAPPCVHADTGETCNYKSWRTRGWCRMEFVAALLACNEVRIMVSRGDALEFVLPMDAAVLLASEGEFTCCTRGHDFGGGPGTAPCDKLKVRGVIETMVDAKIKHLHALPGGRLEARWLVALRHWFLRGLPTAAAEETQSPPPLASDEADERELASLKRRLEWNETHDPDSTGATLVFWAAMADELGATRALLKRTGGSDVRAALRANVPRLSLVRGHTPLTMAMMFARFEIVAALLDAGADPLARDDRGGDAVMYAALFGRTENLGRWLQRFPSWDLNGRRDSATGTNALLGAVTFGPAKAGTVRLLLDAGADPLCTNDVGASTLIHVALNQDADPEAIGVLLEAAERSRGGGVDVVEAFVNHHQEPTTLKWRAILGAARLAVRCGAKHKLLRRLATWKGLTALHDSATNSDVAVCRLLLEAKADPALRNAMGQTPLERARFLNSSGGERGSRGAHVPAPIEELLTSSLERSHQR